MTHTRYITTNTIANSASSIGHGEIIQTKNCLAINAKGSSCQWQNREKTSENIRSGEKYATVSNIYNPIQITQLWKKRQ